MTGFQIFLCVILGFIGLIVLLLSVPVKVSLAFDNKIHLTVKYLFIKLNILPVDPNKPKKPAKPKKKPEPKPEEEKKEAPVSDKVNQEEKIENEVEMPTESFEELFQIAKSESESEDNDVEEENEE